MIVLIPSYEPDRRLVQLVKDLSGIDDLEVLVVDDGSGPAYAPLFAEAERAGVEVLTHPENRGKGAAASSTTTASLGTSVCSAMAAHTARSLRAQ